MSSKRSKLTAREKRDRINAHERERYAADPGFRKTRQQSALKHYHKDIEATRAKEKARKNSQDENDPRRIKRLALMKQWREDHRDPNTARKPRLVGLTPGQKKERKREQARVRQKTYREGYKPRRNALLKEQRKAAKLDPNRQKPDPNSPNKIRERERGRKYEAKNRQKRSAKNRAWLAKNPDKCREYDIKKHGKRKLAAGHHTVADEKAIWEEQKHKCAVPGCTHPINDIRKHKDHYHVDHIQALINGGSDWPDNLQILCRRCNAKKHAEDEYKWAQRELGTLFVIGGKAKMKPKKGNKK